MILLQTIKVDEIRRQQWVSPVTSVRRHHRPIRAPPRINLTVMADRRRRDSRTARLKTVQFSFWAVKQISRSSFLFLCGPVTHMCAHITHRTQRSLEKTLVDTLKEPILDIFFKRKWRVSRNMFKILHRWLKLAFNFAAKTFHFMLNWVNTHPVWHKTSLFCSFY